jgi:16S rRNA G527 N7-methylase RsmG
LPNRYKTDPPRFSTESILAKYNLGSRLEDYLREILLYNDKINLVSRETTAKDLKMIAVDSLVPFEFLPPPNGKIFDIGPGGGFPSIVILLAFPGLEGLLFERTKKKTVFLRKMIDRFGLRVRIMDIDFIEATRGIEHSAFDLGLMKLVRPDPRLLRGALDILKPAGRFIYYSDLDITTVNITAEIKIAKYNYSLDNSNRPRTITVMTKEG